MADVKPKPVNVSKTVEYLNRFFQEATRGLPLAQVAGNFKVNEGKVVRWANPSERETEGERHYAWQVDFAYLINEIQHGPSYIAPKMIADCNNLIATIKQHREAKAS